jgi:hypothetical protein
MTAEKTQSPEWTPDACTLPTAERPLRLAEFDELFASAVRSVRRIEPTRLRLELDGAAETEHTARDLTARETLCCAFFTFQFTRDGERLWLDAHVPAAYTPVLDGLATRVLVHSGAPMETQ